MAESKSSPDVAYHSLSPDTPPSDATIRPSKRKSSTTVLFQVFCLLWLAPVIALLWLNFSDYIIGPSAWCPTEKSCWLDPSNPVTSRTQDNILRFSRNNRNLLGVLQLVAKALEVWFVMIAGALLYLVTMNFASRAEGLPVGFLTRSPDFPGPKGWLEPVQWGTGVRSAERGSSRRLWFLIVLTIVLGILCNLMGPAIAVLAIPTLKWITTQRIGNSTFAYLNADTPPGSDLYSWYSLNTWSSWAYPQCSPEQLFAHNYSCTLDPIGYSLDTWMNEVLATHGSEGFAHFMDGLTIPLTFAPNVTFQSPENVVHNVHEFSNTFTDFTWWIPSRQMIGNLSLDIHTIGELSAGYGIGQIVPLANSYLMYHEPINTYLEYNKSLALELQRNGPILGFIPVFWAGLDNKHHWILSLDDHRQIRCYENYDLADVPFAPYIAHDLYTKCIRTGKGWAANNKYASFTVPGVYNVTTARQEADTSVDIYSSDRAVFLHHGNWPSWLPLACLKNSTSSRPACDWDRFFRVDETSKLANRTKNVITIEMNMNNGTNSATLAMDFVAFQGFTTYTFDTSLITNPTRLIRTQDLPLTGSNVVVDPRWIVAGWATDDGGNLSTQRTSASLVQKVMSDLLLYQALDTTYEQKLTSHSMAFIPIANSLSLIDHQTTPISEPNWPNAKHPLLQRNARMYVWGYFMASRTSVLGAIVAILGSLVVIAQCYFGFVDKRQYRGPIEVLVSALQHVPRGEFEGVSIDDKTVAKVRFQIQDSDGQVRFRSRRSGI